MHPNQLAMDDFLRECRFRFTRASGPGGQNRNKVETAVEVEHVPTGIRGAASERRSQAENRRVAVQRLRCKLAFELATQVDYIIDTARASELWNQYCLRGRIGVSSSNDDFPTMLAIALHAIADERFEFEPSSVRLNTSASQLLKLIAAEPAAFRWLNDQLAAHGKKPRRA